LTPIVGEVWFFGEEPENEKGVCNMCGIWTIKQYREAAAEGNTYQIIGEYVNAAGQEAIMVRHNFEGGEPDIYNVYSEDGRDVNTSFWVYEDEENTQEQLAQAEMTERGFRLKSEAVIATNETTPSSGVVRVQGKTLDEWSEQGRLNEDRDIDDHIHPEPPVDREATEEETRAFTNSLTQDEREYIELKLLFSALA
jgi:hypothetical protein